MMDDLEISGGESGIDRRDFIRKTAIVGGMVWAAPMISSFSRPAFAGTLDNGNKQLCEIGPDGSIIEGQPTGLEWEFVPNSDCFSTTNAAAVEECTGEANGSTTIDVYVQREGGLESKVTNLTDPFYSNGEFGQAGAWVEFTVRNASGGVLHYVRVHTSCSELISIGDQFGAFLLVGGTIG